MFNTPWGKFRWLRLPFGLKIACDVFQEILDRVLRLLEVLHYRGVCLPLKPGSFQQTRVPHSLRWESTMLTYEPQGTAVIPVYLQTTPLKGGCNG